MRIPSVPAVIEQQDRRAEELRKAVNRLSHNLRANMFELADMFEEIMANGYYAPYPSFAEYIDAGEFDVKSRQAEYLMKIKRNSQKLNIAREALLRVKMSKLKEIFRLNVDEQADDIVRLVGEAVNMSLEAVQKEVNELLGNEADGDTWFNVRIPVSVKENVIDPAVEQFRMRAGAEVSIAEVVEGVFAEYNASCAVEQETDGTEA